jgi:hypothetical protein
MVVTFEAARDGGVRAVVNGRTAFPDRRWGTHAPQVGELWEVTVSGENPRGTVYFLMPVKRLASSEDLRRQEREAQEKLENERAAHAWLAKNDLVWAVDHPASVEEAQRQVEETIRHCKVELAELLGGEEAFAAQMPSNDCEALGVLRQYKRGRSSAPRFSEMLQFMLEQGEPRTLKTVLAAISLARFSAQKDWTPMGAWERELQNREAIRRGAIEARAAMARMRRVLALLKPRPVHEMTVPVAADWLVSDAGDWDLDGADDGLHVRIWPVDPPFRWARATAPHVDAARLAGLRGQALRDPEAVRDMRNCLPREEAEEFGALWSEVTQRVKERRWTRVRLVLEDGAEEALRERYGDHDVVYSVTRERTVWMYRDGTEVPSQMWVPAD